VSLTFFEHPSVHPQENLYMQFYGIFFMRPYKQSGRWQDVLHVSSTSCHEHLDVQNMSKTLEFN